MNGRLYERMLIIYDDIRSWNSKNITLTPNHGVKVRCIDGVLGVGVLERF